LLAKARRFSQKHAGFCEKLRQIKMRHSVEAAIKNRITEHGPGWCFTPFHFSDLENDASIRKALSQLEKQKFIRRLARGLYDYPKKHDILARLAPYFAIGGERRGQDTS